MPDFTYPGTGTAAGHPYATPAEHGAHEPLALANYLDAAEGPGFYSDNQWYNLQSLTDVGLSMVLAERWRALSMYRAFVPVQVMMRGANGALVESMTWKGIFAMEPNNDPVGTRQIWFPSNYTDSYSQTIYFKHYADKVALHKYDDRVQAYLFRGRAGLIPIVRTLLSESIVVHLDTLARKAFMEGPRTYYPAGKSDFGGILETDAFQLAVAREVWRDLTYEDVPLAQSPMGDQVGQMFCVTTPSVIFDIINTAGNEWHDVHTYANPGQKLRYEVGMYQNVRYIASRRNVLWNCGELIHQATTLVDYGPGDGASPDLVDKVYQVGQDPTQVTGIVQAIEVDSALNFALNDMVTIHKTRTDKFGVTNGVDHREGNARLRRIVRVDGNTISFDKPLFDDFPAGSFITKAVHIHPSVYMAGPNGVVQGVGEPIGVTTPPPVDDVQAIYRFVWSGYYDTNLFRPEVFRVAFSGGTPPKYGAGVAP